MESRKFCLKCGTEMELNAAFCPRCGEPSAAQSIPQPTPIQQYNMNVQPKKRFSPKINIKATILSNIIPVACLVIGILLLITGLVANVPSDYISSYSMKEYVGGDAYNFIIEANLRGGQIASAEISKCVYIAVGLLISCIAALKINVVKPSKEND